MALAGPWKKEINTHRRIGAAIKAAREATGVTQAYVAKFIGCARSAISSLELGKVGSMELLESVVWALGLNLEVLHFASRRDLPAPLRRVKRNAVEDYAREHVNAAAA